MTHLKIMFIINLLFRENLGGNNYLIFAIVPIPPAIASHDGEVTSERKPRGFFSDCSPFKVSCTGNRAEAISSMHRLIKKPSAGVKKAAACYVRFPTKARRGFVWRPLKLPVCPATTVAKAGCHRI